MNRTILSLVLVMVFALQGWAQEEKKRTDLLTPQELKRKPWYESLEEALLEPEKVYKLRLSNQKIKKLPPEIGLLTNLQHLDLSHNKLKVLPEEIGELHKLEVLNLFHNRLKYVPESFRTLSHVRILYLGRNRLSTIPVWVGGMGHLIRMDLTLNRLTPLEIDNAQQLLPDCKFTF